MSDCLFVLVSGFGGPHWEHKISILENNLRKITAHPWQRIHVRICQYDSHKIPERLVRQYNLDIIYGPGIVGDFIRLHARPDSRDLQGFTHVLLFLDDVEIQDDIDFEKLLTYQRDLSLDITSLSLTHDSQCIHKYMLQQEVDVRVTTVCEYFWYLFPMSGYVKYYPHVSQDNPWMWGLDLVLHKYLNLNVGILGKMTMRHWYMSTGYSLRPDVDPWVGFQRYLTRFNGETQETLAKQLVTRYCTRS
jgi:hypothetical protein